MKCRGESVIEVRAWTGLGLLWCLFRLRHKESGFVLVFCHSLQLIWEGYVCSCGQKVAIFHAYSSFTGQNTVFAVFAACDRFVLLGVLAAF